MRIKIPYETRLYKENNFSFIENSKLNQREKLHESEYNFLIQLNEKNAAHASSIESFKHKQLLKKLNKQLYIHLNMSFIQNFFNNTIITIDEHSTLTKIYFLFKQTMVAVIPFVPIWLVFIGIFHSAIPKAQFQTLILLPLIVGMTLFLHELGHLFAINILNDFHEVYLVSSLFVVSIVYISPPKSSRITVLKDIGITLSGLLFPTLLQLLNLILSFFSIYNPLDVVFHLIFLFNLFNYIPFIGDGQKTLKYFTLLMLNHSLWKQA